MSELPYSKISLFLYDISDLDFEPVNFEINDDEFNISRDYAGRCIKNPELPEIPGFYVSFSTIDAIRLRDFLNHALPSDYHGSD